MSQSPFYLEHYLDSLETLPGELRRNFTKMTDKDVMNKDIMVQIDGASDDYLRKVRDLSPTKRKAEMEKIQVTVKTIDFCWLLWWWITLLLVIGLSKGLPGGNGGLLLHHPHTVTHLPNVNISQHRWLLNSVCQHSLRGFSILQSRAVMPPLFLPPRCFAKSLNRELHTCSLYHLPRPNTCSLFYLLVPTHQTPRH